ncbi:MAG: fructosamine kinase family protein [Sulfurovum sp.]|nr:fructosamine kinase family protein [Sulfurovum sp.]
MEIQAWAETVLSQKVTGVDFLTQGQIGSIYTVQTSVGKYLLKTSKPSDRLQTEANMLKDIKKYGISTPEVFAVSDTYLLTAYIEEEHVPDAIREKMAAETLAKLHSVTNDSRMYGYWYDTTIGPFSQNNEQTQYNWALFLGQMRMMPMARVCYDKGVINKQILMRIEGLCRDLYKRIDMSKIVPSLIHGDLWSGNILFNMSGATLIDPALYFADREMELAFILMFDTFGQTFFEHYTRIHPLSEDFYELKVPLYQIYPLLVHAALYGGIYVQMLERRLMGLKA